MNTIQEEDDLEIEHDDDTDLHGPVVITTFMRDGSVRGSQEICMCELPQLGPKPKDIWYVTALEVDESLIH